MARRLWSPMLTIDGALNGTGKGIQVRTFRGGSIVTQKWLRWDGPYLTVGTYNEILALVTAALERELLEVFAVAAELGEALGPIPPNG